MNTKAQSKISRTAQAITLVMALLASNSWAEQALDPRVESVFNQFEGTYSLRARHPEAQSTKIVDGFYRRSYSSGVSVQVQIGAEEVQYNLPEEPAVWVAWGDLDNWYDPTTPRKVMVIIDGITTNLTYTCGVGNCEDRPNYLTPLLVPADALQVPHEIHDFRWSGDLVGNLGQEPLLEKFDQWFQGNVCRLDEACEIAFVAHSWGSVILSEWISALPETHALHFKSVVTFGSPLSGLITADQSSLALDAIVKVQSQGSIWANMVHPEDPIAWDIDYAVNVTEEAINDSGQVLYSHKGVYNQPLSLVENAQLDSGIAYLTLFQFFTGITEENLESSGGWVAWGPLLELANGTLASAHTPENYNLELVFRWSNQQLDR